ncbi:helix-turn-helix transcriptional regulator (plasmid) [Pantoea agglomerans]|uniref:helix-turn-helix domain-containing protein n=1 Tax=Enterobacter agglomerans TaxID=549 RepID=UPI0017810976|nr:helix-turn-helix transcriptional regulator [Pantoea agglomerans]WVL92331.1 helix-turn-helix transcriptional regulator [Pantoea agglomerans]
MLKTLGERLAKVLDKIGINQSEAAVRTGISKATISHLIRNKVENYKNSNLLADGLNVNHDWLVYGRGGILNPTVRYVPIIQEYFRLRLYQSEGFLEDSTHFLVTEHNYGEGMFATQLDDSILICSRPDENEYPERKTGFLLWTERRKAIINDQVQGKRVFLIHEIRRYESMLENIF